MIDAIVKYYAELWTSEQNRDNSIEEFVSMTIQKVTEESLILDKVIEKSVIQNKVKQRAILDGFNALTESRIEDRVTKEYILEELILHGINQERNRGGAEVVRSKFKKVFEAYEQSQASSESRLVCNSTFYHIS